MQSTPDEHPEPAAICVLLVEDNPVDARMMEVLFKKIDEHPFELVWVESLADGIQRAAEGGIDLVLLDLTLPDSEGLETFRRLHEAAGHLPIIVMSGLRDARLAVQTVQQGAQDYLVKGHVDAHLLERSMRYGLERQRTAAQLAKYTQELSDKHKQMKDELHLAREIQKAYLPPQAMAFPTHASEEDAALHFYHFYAPTEALGGDFFIVLPLSDTQAGVLICDVIGHGVQAALITSVLRGLIEELKSLATNPGKFLTKMNRGLMSVLRSPGTPSLTTAFYLLCDVSDGLVQYATAGHPSPLLIRPATGSVQPLPFDQDIRGPALGMIDDAVYTCASATLTAGDLVMMFTDGLYEFGGTVSPDRQDTWLVDTVQQHVALPATQLFEKLVAEASSCCPGVELTDDVCIVGMQVTRLGSD